MVNVPRIGFDSSVREFLSLEVQALTDDSYEPLGYSTEISEGNYLVESILGIAIVQCEVRYRVKWVNWPDEFNTWEPLSHLSGSDDTTREFHAKLEDFLQSPRRRRRFQVWWNYVCSLKMKRPGFTCVKCLKSFTRKSSLIRHSKYLHGRRGRCVRCHKCKKTFKNQESLFTHKNQVCRIQTVPCPFCANNVLPKYLKSHIDGKHKKKRAVCYICRQRLWKKNLLMHIRTQHESC